MAVFLVDSLFHMLRAGKNRRGEKQGWDAELCEQMEKFEKKT